MSLSGPTNRRLYSTSSFRRSSSSDRPWFSAPNSASSLSDCMRFMEASPLTTEPSLPTSAPDFRSAASSAVGRSKPCASVPHRMAVEAAHAPSTRASSVSLTSLSAIAVSLPWCPLRQRGGAVPHPTRHAPPRIALDLAAQDSDAAPKPPHTPPHAQLSNLAARGVPATMSAASHPARVLNELDITTLSSARSRSSTLSGSCPPRPSTARRRTGR